MNVNPSRPMLPALTSLRFFAALHVLLFHMYAMQILQGSGFYRNLASIGYVGVSFFFVLSGFILVYTYAGRQTPLGRFWQARFARIYPAYLFSLLVTLPFFLFVCLKLKDLDIPMFAWQKAHIFPAMGLVLGLLQSWVPMAALSWNAPAWSLSVEAFFYLLFPFLLAPMLTQKSRRLMWIILGCWIVSAAICVGYVVVKPDGLASVSDATLNQPWLNVVKFFPLVRLPEFLMGMALGVIFLREPIRRDRATAMILTGVAALIAVVALSPRIPYPVLHDGLLAPAYAAVIYGAALNPAWLRVLESKFFILLGEASYSFYLLHSFLVSVYFMPMGKVRATGILGTTIGFLLPIVVSILVFKFIETPARQWLRPRKRSEIAIATAVARSAATL
jgi:peptidoglycan/LPS O-acetylase OafA/YrhL